MKSRLVISIIVMTVVLLAGCGGNPAANLTITPPPTLGPTTVLTPLAVVPGQATSAPQATEAATGAATSSAGRTPEAAENEGTATPESGDQGPPQPNCTGGADCSKPGAAITQNLKGDTGNGQKLFAANCASCHGDQGKGGVANPGSADGTVPPLNPADDAFTKKDPAQFAQQLDLFIEHGSHTDGIQSMPNWGDAGTLTPQQIADVIAYIISLNPPQ